MRIVALALALAAASTLNWAQPAQARTASAAKIAQMDHVSIEAIGNPKGSPVFLIPGLSMSRENWRSTADRIAGAHRVYLVQLNGFGGSAAGANVGPGLMQGVVEDLHQFIRANHVQNARIVGHSLGGTLALLMAKMHPDDVHGIMLVDALPWVALIAAPPTVTTAQIEPMAAAMRDKFKATYGQPMNQDQAKATIAALALKPASRTAALQWMQGADPRVSGEAFYEDMMLDMRADLSGIATPITLLYPHADNGPAKDAADALYHNVYAKTPHITYVPVDDSGHFIMLDQPAAFDSALDTFLAQ